jgi:glyoxylase-like metal-dependent hydrolase (beta-lactamase superfamily II)
LSKAQQTKATCAPAQDAKTVLQSATNAIGSREEPIKYLVNTHNHFDHDDGIRTYVADGATIITNAMNFGENNLDFGDENESDDSKVL